MAQKLESAEAEIATLTENLHFARNRIAELSDMNKVIIGERNEAQKYNRETAEEIIALKNAREPIVKELATLRGYIDRVNQQDTGAFKQPTNEVSFLINAIEF